MSARLPASREPSGLPDDFFDTDKKSKKAQDDDLNKEMEQFEREMAALQAESEEQIREEFEKIQYDKNIEELDQQIDQWKRIVDLEKRAEELMNKTASKNPNKRLKVNSDDAGPGTTKTHQSTVKLPTPSQSSVVDEFQDLDDIENFEDKLFDWRSSAMK